MENYGTRRTRELKARLRQRLGNKCIRCGFSDWRALQFDHIKGGVGRNRKTGWAYFKELETQCNAGELQLLCANCNWIKRFENHEIELGGAYAPYRALRKEVFLERLKRVNEAGLEIPKKKFGDRRTAHTIIPTLQKLLMILDEPIKAQDAADILMELGWKFGQSARSVLGAMIVRTAARRRPDVFVINDDAEIELTANAPILNPWVCVSCGHRWVPRIGFIPRNCAKCKRSCYGFDNSMRGEARVQALQEYCQKYGVVIPDLEKAARETRMGIGRA